MTINYIQLFFILIKFLPETIINKFQEWTVRVQLIQNRRQYIQLR